MEKKSTKTKHQNAISFLPESLIAIALIVVLETLQK
jgi:hypothetical protein